MNRRSMLIKLAGSLGAVTLFRSIASADGGAITPRPCAVGERGPEVVIPRWSINIKTYNAEDFRASQDQIARHFNTRRGKLRSFGLN